MVSPIIVKPPFFRGWFTKVYEPPFFHMVVQRLPDIYIYYIYNIRLCYIPFGVTSGGPSSSSPFFEQIQPRGPSDSHRAVAEVLIFLLWMAGFMTMMEQARESQELNNTL